MQKKAESAANAEGVQFPNGFAFDSVNHNIADVGLKVKQQTETLQFKNWFKNSKVVDQNGKPLVVYHGTNWDILSEAPGEAVFDDKYRGAGSGDNGFYGRGFYFTFGNGEASKGEAGYYGKNVYQFYLSIQNPFYFTETLLNWNGKRVLGDEVSSVEIINAVKLFPEPVRRPDNSLLAALCLDRTGYCAENGKSVPGEDQSRRLLAERSGTGCVSTSATGDQTGHPFCAVCHDRHLLRAVCGG